MISNGNEIFSKDFRQTQIVRILAGSSIVTIIALIHIFRAGSYFTGSFYFLYYSYASDLMIPFGIYFLLCINELYIRILRPWYIKASIIIALTTFMEFLQLFGIYALGTTFDLYDIVAYVTGAAIAVFFDRFVFSNYIPNWNLKSH